MSHKMRVGLDARYINDRYHGIGRFAFRLFEALVTGSRELDFTLFRGNLADTRFDWQGLAERPNVDVVSGPTPLFWPQEQLLWPWLLRKHRIDLFYTPYFVAPFFASSDVKVFVTIHDLIFERYPQYMPLAWGRFYYQMLIRSSLKRAEKIFCVSSSTAGDVARFYHLDREKMILLPEGVDPNFSAPSSMPSTQQAVPLQGRPYILAVGARRPHKNYARLVQAYAQSRISADYDLVFVGPPDHRFPDEALENARRLGLNGKIKFLDWVPEADLPGMYRCATALVFPSLIEGFGLPALEAMTSGTPVIAAASPALQEVLHDSGVFFDPSDTAAIAAALDGTLSNHELLQRMSFAGMKRATSFTWERSAGILRAALWRS